MRLIDALAKVLALDQPAFRTSDAAVCLRVDRRHASKILERLADAGHLVRLARALWGVPGRLDAFALPGYLAAPFPAYVSLHSALFHHGMVSQIPSVIYAVTVGRARRRETPIGVVSFHHVAPSFFAGYEGHGRGGIKIATPEKALLDVLYLGAGRSEGLGALPELELPRGFSVRRSRQIIALIGSPERRRRVEQRLAGVLAADRARPR
jgi:predicted transcriptional regulator of viral defense system